MQSNLDKYKRDLDSLMKRGNALLQALSHQRDYGNFRKQAEKKRGATGYAAFVKELPNFNLSYQGWYSEAKALVRQLTPDRIDDFARLYDKPKTRKEITWENYTIEDALQGVEVTRGHADDVVANADAAIPRVMQQVAIVRGAAARFESSLFDIRQVAQADLFDSELEAAAHLLSSKFTRAAGAVAGVVLEAHLSAVCTSRGVALRKKDPSISDLNDALKAGNVIEVAQWRSVQFLGDIRNLCDHKKKDEPTSEQVKDLIDGVAKVIKTIS